MSTSIINLYGEVDTDMYAKVCKKLIAFEDATSIFVDINSTGGSVYDALAISGKLKNSGKHITTRIFGACMSAATLISASGSLRLMNKDAWWMLHDASSTWKGNISEGENNLKQLKREERQWLYLLSNYTQVPTALFSELSTKSQYLNAKECLHYGIIDEII